MIRNRRILGVDSRRRGIEQMETFGRDARDHFGGHAAPGESFADRKSRPVRATEASTVSVSSGFTVRRSTTSISNPSFANLLSRAKLRAPSRCS